MRSPLDRPWSGTRPDDGGLVRVPTEFRQHSEYDALRDRLLVRDPFLRRRAVTSASVVSSGMLAAEHDLPSPHVSSAGKARDPKPEPRSGRRSIGRVVLDRVDDECPQLADVCLNIVEPGFKTRVHVVDPAVDIVETRVGRARADTESHDDRPNADEEREPIFGRHARDRTTAGIPHATHGLRRRPADSVECPDAQNGPVRGRLRRSDDFLFGLRACMHGYGLPADTR